MKFYGISIQDCKKPNERINHLLDSIFALVLLD